jgi:hypothetical protein
MKTGWRLLCPLAIAMCQLMTPLASSALQDKPPSDNKSDTAKSDKKAKHSKKSKKSGRDDGQSKGIGPPAGTSGKSDHD